MVVYGSYTYKKPLRKLIAFDIKGVLSALDSIDIFLNSQNKGYFVGYITYEAGVLLSTYKLGAYEHLHKAIIQLHQSVSYTSPLLYFTLFKKRKKFKFLHTHTKPSLHIVKGLDSKAYTQGFQVIKNHIHKGDSYQVNFTQEILLHSPTKPKHLFKQLLSHQNTTYKAYMKNVFMEILCFSPELFFKVKNHTITAQPMKGTIKRGKGGEDRELKGRLQADSKNRSENIMIVDLLRNDLSKIIKPHSLRVKELCAIHSYPSLHQMVSTLQGRLAHICIREIFQALFPCGSISGAPKLKTMEIIHSLESRLRGVYCGALGVISAKDTSLCVPIRTLFKHSSESCYHYGVGSGVVWDSVCEEEYAELALKSRFLSAKEDYALFETMLYDEGHIFLLAQHLNRMYKSACDLGFESKLIQRLCAVVSPSETNISDDFITRYSYICFDGEDRLWGRAHFLFEFLQMPLPYKRCIVRLTLSRDGVLNLSISPLDDIASHTLLVSSQNIDKHNPLIYHKTTQRAHFANAQELIKEHKIFDMLYCNKKGFVSEGSRSNVLCEIEGRYYTPRIQNGLLGGTLRAVLLDNGCIREKNLYLKHLKKASRILCINSVRGIVEVKLNTKCIECFM